MEKDIINELEEEHVHKHAEHKEHCLEHHDHDHEGHECSGHGVKHVHERHEHNHKYHDHDYDEHCDCGHDHDHDHNHEGHEHHDHGTKYDVPGYDLVETHKHEGATVCSFERKTSMDADEASTAFEEAMIDIEGWLNAQGAIIGHVKGYVRKIDGTALFSTVGAGLNVTENEGGGAELGFASIVFGPSEVEVKDKVIEAFSRIH